MHVKNDIAAAHPEWVSNGAKIVVIDYDSPQTIVDAFYGIDVVISTVGGAMEGLLRQQDLVVAAKSASVKLFVPSEFECPQDPNSPFYAIKTKITDKIEEIDIPYAIFYTGLWPDMVFSPSVAPDSYSQVLNVSIGFLDGILKTAMSTLEEREMLSYLSHPALTLLDLFPMFLLISPLRISSGRLSVLRATARYV
jgi:hypothetical protein